MAPRVRDDLPHAVRVVETEWIPLSDGTRLAAPRTLPGPADSTLEFDGDYTGDGTPDLAGDFDGNGRRDLIRSIPDALASTANYLRGYGWQKGGPLAEGTPNFEVLKEWNRAQVYQKTIALFSQRLASE